MTKRYFMLQRKLEDAESELRSVFSLPASGTPSRQFLSQYIRQRLLFLNNLLSAEFAASDSKRTEHLRHVARRLTNLEAAFRAWDNDEDEATPADDVSVCSCTESCLNDEDNGGEDAKEEDPAADEWNDLLVPEEGDGLAKRLKNEEREKEGKEKVGERGKWRLVSTVGRMLVVGAVMMAMFFFGFVLRHLDRGDAFIVTPT